MFAYILTKLTPCIDLAKYDIERRTPVVGISGYNTLAPNDPAATMEHLATVGPLAVAADATPWQLYGSGVFSGCNYDHNIGLNHAIQLVGWVEAALLK